MSPIKSLPALSCWVLVLVSLATPSGAAELGFSLGSIDVFREQDAFEAGIDFTYAPWRWGLKPHVGLHATTDESFYGYAGLRRPSSTRSRPQPVRRRRPGRGLARLAGCGGISRKLPCGFLQGTAFPLGDSRASSIVVCSSTIGNAQNIFVGCVSRSGISAGWPPRNSVFPVLVVVLASRFAEGLAVVLTA